MTWLADEMRAAADRIELKHCQRLAAMGVTEWPKLTEQGLIGLVRCTVGKNDIYEPAEDGTDHIALAVLEDGALVDIVAFTVDDPQGWALRTGNGWALGVDNIRYAQGGWGEADSTLRMCATPLDWLRAGCEGACIIDGYSWQASSEVRNVKSLEVDSPAMARALRLQLSKPPQIPEINVKRGQRHAA
jgi:hypothetical protein